MPGQRPQYDAALVLAVFPDGGHGGGGIPGQHVTHQALKDAQGNIEFRGFRPQGNVGIALQLRQQ